MNAIRFQLRATPPQRIDLSCLTPDRLIGTDIAEVLRTDVSSSRRTLKLGEICTVTDGERDKIVIEGGSDRLDFVGRGMTQGEITVEGDVGVQAGRSMTGGRLNLRGNSGHWTGSGMRGGAIEIAGSAGDFLGGAEAGERTGMRGGTIVVRGTVGAHAADRLRRGMIIVEGDAGPYAGGRVVAGTLIVCGTAGEFPGYLMRRGTIVLNRASRLSPTFAETAPTSLVFTELLARSVMSLSESAARVIRTARHRWAGDLAVMGKGEIFTSG